jgi:hypothetical protein
VSIEVEAQKDLELSDTDAENIVGGQKKRRAHKKAAPHVAAASIRVSFTTPADQVSTTSGDSADCDPGDPDPTV